MELVILVSGEAHDCRGLQEEQVGGLIPTVGVPGQQVALGILVTHEVGANFLDHADEAGAAGTSVEPNGQGGGFGLGPGGYEDVVNFPASHLGVEIAGIDGLVDHALNDERATGGMSESLLGRDRAREQSRAR